MIDSLRRAVSAAEQTTQGLDAKLRAIRATDFATIAQQSQGAVGLITVSFGRDYYSGTGFAITGDGYMLTNWHVVADSQRSEEHTSELQSRLHLVCRLLLEKKKKRLRSQIRAAHDDTTDATS